MGMTFKKATKVQAKLRLAIAAPPGGGKTWTALTLAKHLGGSVALIDTEHGSASKYASTFDFDTLELDNFSLDNYVSAIKAAESAGYDILVIDSLSHAWVGAGGALEEVDNLKRASRTSNGFTDGWGKVTPKHNRLIDTILASPMHVIATMRQKMSYELETVNGRSNTPVKKGLAPIQREGMEYEFDIIGEMDPVDNTMRISKTRCPELMGKVFEKPGKELATILKAWLSDGAPAATQPPAFTNAAMRTDLAAIRKLAADKGISDGTLIETVGRDYGVETLEELTEANAALLKARLEKAPAKKAA